MRCEVVNINPGFSEGVVSASPTLAGYVFFVGRVREYNLAWKVPLHEAVGRAIDDCIAAGHLVDYPRERRAEVLEMSFPTEFDEERYRERRRREGYERGYDQGVKQGMKQGMKQGAADLSSLLRERGVDPSLIEDALASMSPIMSNDRKV